MKNTRGRRQKMEKEDDVLSSQKVYLHFCKKLIHCTKIVIIIIEFDKYFVCPPLASSTACMRRGIDSYKAFRYDGVILFQTFSAILFNP